VSGHRPWREIVRKSQISLAKRVTEQIVTAPTSRLFAWLQYVRPYTAEQAIKQEMPIGRRIGRGVFRDTYALVGHPDLVIKFPTDQSIRIYSDDAGHDSCANAEKHIETEMFNVRFINKSAAMAALRPHIPTIYFYDPLTHVQVSKRYRKVSNSEESIHASRVLYKLFRAVAYNIELDFGLANTMVDENGRQILVDLGFRRIR